MTATPAAAGWATLLKGKGGKSSHHCAILVLHLFDKARAIK